MQETLQKHSLEVLRWILELTHLLLCTWICDYGMFKYALLSQIK